VIEVGEVIHDKI